jgi:competence protein ComEC
LAIKSQAHHWALPALAWLAGLGLLQQCPRLPLPLEFAALAGLLLVAAASALWCWRRAAPVRVALWLSVVALLLAFLQGAWRADTRLAQALPEAWEGRDVRVSGQVASLPSATAGLAGAPGWRFEFELSEAHAGPAMQDPPLLLPPRLLLSWFAEAGDTAPLLGAGERWQFVVRLKRPQGLMNPYAFDHELWLFEQDLRATGVVRAAAAGGLVSQPQRLSPAPWWSLDAWRQRLREALQRQVPDAGHAGVLAALSLGDQAAIVRADWALFRDTGVAHLLSVSGLHVTMFAWGAQALLGWLWRRSARLCGALPAPTAARWAGVAAALAYALFSGWGVPAQRTVWMLASVAGLRGLGLRWPWPLCLLAAAVIVTVIDPFAISQAGFWLSFAAVGLLMASGGEQPPPASGWRAQGRAVWQSQWVATLGLAPLSLLFFQQLSAVGLLANLVAIPLVSFVITPLALAGALVPGLWWLAEWGVQLLMVYLHWLASWPGGVWILPVAPKWAQVAGLLGGALLVLPLPKALRALGPAFLLPLLWPAPLRPAPGQFELLAADVGQGTAVLVRTERHNLLFDAGPQYAPGIDAGQRVLLPLLRALGVKQLDVLMLSHRDSDHVGGAASLLGALPVAVLHSSLESGHALLAGPVPLQPQQQQPQQQRPCLAGQHWDWDGVHFELLHPLADAYPQAGKSNAMSCVLRVSGGAGVGVDAGARYPGRVALLTGDIEAAQELALLQRLPAAALRADVLLVPHHGSKTSSTNSFLAAVSPHLALVQAGYRNRFGHPAPAVLARYQALGILTLASPDCGAWQWRSLDGVWQCQRQQGLRYWHRRPAAVGQVMGPWPDDELPF